MKSNGPISKLLLAAKVSNGIFTSGQIAENKIDTNAFFIFKMRHPEHFKKIFNGERTSIYQLTNDFYAHHNIIPKNEKMSYSKIDMAQSLAWLAYCLEYSIEEQIPDCIVKINGETNFLDDYSDGILQHEGFKIITIPQRKKVILETKNYPIVGPSLCKTWCKLTLKKLFSTPDLPLLPRGIWPKSIDDCHKDARYYPGLNQKMTGKEKWDWDQSLIKNKMTDLKNYFFGVHRP